MSTSQKDNRDIAALENAAPGSYLIDQVAEWLMEQALGKSDLRSLLAGCCERLHAAGIPLRRCHTSFRTLHPVIQAMGLTWNRGSGVEILGYRHENANQTFQKSPHFYMLQNGVPLLRRRLTGSEAQPDFDVLRDLQSEGMTDYLAYLIAFDVDAGAESRDGMIGSWACDREGGFSDNDIQALIRIQRRLAVAYKVMTREQITHNIVDTYLGPEAGRKVLAGQIQRGDYESIDAVIWYSDLRDSTHMSETMSPDAYLAVLNDYFECTAGAVIEAGGEVLLLLGDAVLAIFRTNRDGAHPSEAANRALSAAHDAARRLDKLNLERRGAGTFSLAFGAVLHVGEVMYGNIGVSDRLQFTVTGPAVNEVARLENLTKELDRTLLVSRAFADLVKQDWQSLGKFERQGVPKPLEVLAPASEQK